MEQGFVLFNASHHERRPKGPRAALRLLGGFSEAADAKEHALQLPQDCDLLLAPIGKAFALTKSLPQDEGAHLRRLLAAHLQRLRDHEREFVGNVAEQTAGQVSNGGGGGGGGAATAEGTTDPAPPAAVPERISRQSEVRLQNFAVLSVLPDCDELSTDQQEPGVVVWGLYDTEAAARDAIRQRLSSSVKDLHLEVVAMYEWLHPTEVSKHLDELEEEFRDETLTSIIAQRKEERRKVRDFRELCGEAGAPMVDLSQPEPRRVGFDQPTRLEELSQGSSEAVAPGA